MTQILCLLGFSGYYKVFTFTFGVSHQRSLNWPRTSQVSFQGNLAMTNYMWVNPYKALAHCGSLIDGARALRYFIMSSTGITFRMPIRDPPLLTILFFCWWYSESNTTESEYDLYHIVLLCIHRHYTKFIAKPKLSKIAGFKEYAAIASHLGPINEGVSSSED